MPTVIFIAAIAAVIIGGLVRAHPVVPVAHGLSQATQTVGALLLLRAFASGCSALTGVEAIANAVPSFRRPRVRRAQHTEMWLGIVLGAMLLGLAVLIRKFHVGPSPSETAADRSAARAAAEAQLPRRGAGRRDVPADPIVDYLRTIEQVDPSRRLVVLIPEVQPARPWQRILYNQRGFVLDRAIQHGTDNVVICRLHFKLSAVSAPSPAVPRRPP